MNIHVEISDEGQPRQHVATIFGTPEQIVPMLIQMLVATGMPKEKIRAVFEGQKPGEVTRLYFDEETKTHTA